MPNETSDPIKEHFKALPKIVQDAITSADVEKRLRALAEKHRLHLDQWQVLENQVVMTLMGLEKVEELSQNIKNEVRVDPETARALATDISLAVFEPIRQELERGLDHPEAVEEETEPMEDLRSQILENHQLGRSADTPIEEKPLWQQKEELQEQASLARNQDELPPQNEPREPDPISNESSIVAHAPRPTEGETAPTKPEVKRGAIAESYAPGQASSQRKDVDNDPYRESVE